MKDDSAETAAQADPEVGSAQTTGGAPTPAKKATAKKAPAKKKAAAKSASHQAKFPRHSVEKALRIPIAI